MGLVSTYHSQILLYYQTLPNSKVKVLQIHSFHNAFFLFIGNQTSPKFKLFYLVPTPYSLPKIHKKINIF